MSYMEKMVALPCCINMEMLVVFCLPGRRVVFGLEAISAFLQRSTRARVEQVLVRPSASKGLHLSLMYDAPADFEEVFLHVACCSVVVFAIFGICRIPEHLIEVVA